jgi:hypothetical protein
MEDKKLLKWVFIVLLAPLALAYFSDVTRTCPEHIFKGQRDPRLGPPKDEPAKTNNLPTPPVAVGSISQGACNCGK